MKVPGCSQATSEAMSRLPPTIDEWRTRFSEEQIEKSDSACVANPSQYFSHQQRDRRWLEELRLVEPGAEPPFHLTDIFLLARGAPPARDLTQIGGLPYRPRSDPWPVSQAGKPMNFLGQLRFAESRDLLGGVPGDLLLVFVDEPWIEQVVVEWRMLGLEDLATAADVPAPPAWEFVHCYGVRYRVREYVAGQGIPATKIGGKPPYYSGLKYRSRGAAPDIAGTFLGCIASVQAPANVPYPWLDMERPITLDVASQPSETLCLTDMGRLYFFFQADGSVVCDFET